MPRISRNPSILNKVSTPRDAAVARQLAAVQKGHLTISKTVRDAPQALMGEVLAALFPEHSKLPQPSRADYFEARRQRLVTEDSHLGQCRNILARALRELDSRGSSAHHQSQIDKFILSFPRLQAMMDGDACAILGNDPAARSVRDVVLTYPGWAAVATYRIAHELHRLGVESFPRMLSEHAHQKYQIDIHPGARIGQRFSIDHGTGVVIGETAEVGNDVSIFHNVTLGAKRVAVDMAGLKRHPTIGDGVTIYNGAGIYGGDVAVGSGSVIGGGARVFSSVPPDVTAYEKDGKIAYKPHADRVIALTLVS